VGRQFGPRPRGSGLVAHLRGLAHGRSGLGSPGARRERTQALVTVASAAEVARLPPMTRTMTLVEEDVPGKV
jgi:hypothetical protein